MTSAVRVSPATVGSSSMSPKMAKSQAGVNTSSTITIVMPTLSSHVKLRSRRRLPAPSTSAVEALMIMMTGASTMMARLKATP